MIGLPKDNLKTEDFKLAYFEPMKPESSSVSLSKSNRSLLNEWEHQTKNQV